MNQDNQIVNQLDRSSWLIRIADLIHLIIIELDEGIFKFVLIEILFTEKKVLFSSKPKTNLEESINDIFDLIYLLLNKENCVFDYEELEEIRKTTLIFFGQNYPEKLGNKLTFSENLLVESFKLIEKNDLNTAISLLREGIHYDKWNVNINLLLLDTYIKMNDYSGSEDLILEINMGLKDNKMIFQKKQEQKFEELKKLQSKIEPPDIEIDPDDSIWDELFN